MGPVVGKVPLDSGTDFLAPSELARARHGMMKKKRPHIMTRPPAVDQNLPLTVIPAKALPLLPVWEIVAYRISDRPCGPWLSTASFPAGTTAAIAASPRAVTQK